VALEVLKALHAITPVNTTPSAFLGKFNPEIVVYKSEIVSPQTSSSDSLDPFNVVQVTPFDVAIAPVKNSLRKYMVLALTVGLTYLLENTIMPHGSPMHTSSYDRIETWNCG
jgi:hypothetical protein